MKEYHLDKITKLVNGKIPFLEDNEFVIGVNSITYTWEYDNLLKYAFIILDNDNNISIKMVQILIKTGLGAGEYYDVPNTIEAGTLEKPFKRRILQFLSIHNSYNSKFNRGEWYTINSDTQRDLNDIFNDKILLRGLKLRKIVNNINV